MTSKSKTKAKPVAKKAKQPAIKNATSKRPLPKKARTKIKGPQSLAAIARGIRNQPKPRLRIIDVLAYAAIKTIDQATASEQSAAEKAEQSLALRQSYQNALKASKDLAANPPPEKATARQRAAYERKSNRLLEALLLYKVALTLDVLGVPPTGKPEEDIFNIGMNCIGNLDYRFVAPSENKLTTESEPFFFEPKSTDNKQIKKEALQKAKRDAYKIAVAQYFNIVLYDLKTEDVLRFNHPELETDNAVPALATAYQSIFEMKLVKKKPVYRVKRSVFKGEKRAKDFIKSLEALEARLGLMQITPESTGSLVTEGRMLLVHEKSGKTKPGLGPFGFIQKLVGGGKR